MKLEFFGAAGEVTGSCHIVRTRNHCVLLDCGLIQGGRKDEMRNWETFPFDPREVDAVVLSHAHIDHSGRLPLLVKRGFRGPVYTQNATRDLCTILLLDAAHLNERDSEIENRKRERKGLRPVEPLYHRQDARAALVRIKGLPYGATREILPGISIRFRDAGHIMGSAIVEMWLRDGDTKRKLVFSGDLGQYDAPILNDPEAIEDADVVLMECTYGDRLHRNREQTVREIGEIIAAAEHERGNVLIPAFAIGRSQEILYLFGKHYDEWQLDRWHIFLDSPMAIDASEVYWNYSHLYDSEAARLHRSFREMPRLPNLHLTETPEESRVINRLRNGAIIIAGSGMCTGGRIMHHLKHNVWRPECHVIIVGYQAAGSLGRDLVDGRQYVRIYRETVRVAAKIHTVGGLSAHGDQRALCRWYGGFEHSPPVYLVHGETESAAAFKVSLEQKFGSRVALARPGQVLDLTRA